MERLKILHIITRLDKGGSAENTLLTAMGLNKDVYQVDILAGYSKNPPSENEVLAIAQGVGVARIDHLIRDVNLRKDLVALWKIFRHIRRGKYHLVHTHTSKAGFMGRIAARLAGIRAIVHTPHGHVFHGYFPPAKTKVFILLERFCMRLTSALITLTEKGKQEHLAVGIGPSHRIMAIPSGVPLSPYLRPSVPLNTARLELGIPTDRFVVGTIARLVPVKNHALLVAAAPLCIAKAPNILFVFVGGGPLEKRLQTEISFKGLSPYFQFFGWRNDITSFLTASDLFALPSLNEGMGRAFVEAQANGVPVIGPRVGGVPDVIKEGKTGLLIDPQNPQDLANAIIELQRDPQRRKQMAVACREWVNPQFSVEKMVETIDGLYRSLLKGKVASTWVRQAHQPPFSHRKY